MIRIVISTLLTAYRMNSLLAVCRAVPVPAGGPGRPALSLALRKFLASKAGRALIVLAVVALSVSACEDYSGSWN